MKYETLVKILDKISEDAPEELTIYKKRESIEDLNLSRSRCFIHLFLKVRFGISTFIKREELITDGINDGGIDAYYLDEENKRLFLIQSKFRTNENNFEIKSLSAEDLIKMEVEKVLKGIFEDDRGNEFNGKIKDFVKRWSQIPDSARYEIKVIFLGNVRGYTKNQIKRLIGGLEFEIFDFERSYHELVYPLCSGTYHYASEIVVTLNLSKKYSPILEQSVNTSYGEFQVIILFVPIGEIGQIMNKYKNSILEYNPRHYLSYSKNPVNKKIFESAISQEENIFALLNNGITFLADSFFISKGTGKLNIGQIIVSNPQIINGGQTAHTLGIIYEKNPKDLERIFGSKEVMIRVICKNDEDSSTAIKFIEDISDATNQQSRVDEADRRSNDKIQKLIQIKIFEIFGMYYERKKGEFFQGLDAEYIEKEQVINRDVFLRAYHAVKGNPSDARRAGSDILFSKENFKRIIGPREDIKKMVFAYLIHRNLNRLKKEDWGFGIRYGKFAIVRAIGIIMDFNQLNTSNMEERARKEIQKIQLSWKQFEEEIKIKPENQDYSSEEGDFDFDGYYKGKTLNKDLEEVFSKALSNKEN